MRIHSIIWNGQFVEKLKVSVFFILKKNGNALPISALDMDQKERRLYGRR
jgi:hypothetical protein